MSVSILLLVMSWRRFFSKRRTSSCLLKFVQTLRKFTEIGLLLSHLHFLSHWRGSSLILFFSNGHFRLTGHMWVSMNFCYRTFYDGIYASSNVINIAFLVETVFHNLVGLQEMLKLIRKFLILMGKNVYVRVKSFNLLGKLIWFGDKPRVWGWNRVKIILQMSQFAFSWLKFDSSVRVLYSLLFYSVHLVFECLCQLSLSLLMTFILIIKVENFTVYLTKITADLSHSVLIGNHTSVLSDNICFFCLYNFSLVLDSSSVVVNLANKGFNGNFQTIVFILLQASYLSQIIDVFILTAMVTLCLHQKASCMLKC